MTSPSPAADSTAGLEPSRDRRLLRDVLWGQPVFRAPPLVNPQFVSDPLPYRALAAHARRPGEPAAFRPLRAA